MKTVIDDVPALVAENEKLKLQLKELSKDNKTLLRHIGAWDNARSAAPVTADECVEFVARLGSLRRLGEYLDSTKQWNPSTIKWWTKRGMPPATQLRYGHRIASLRACLAAAETKT